MRFYDVFESGIAAIAEKTPNDSRVVIMVNVGISRDFAKGTTTQSTGVLLFGSHGVESLNSQPVTLEVEVTTRARTFGVLTDSQAFLSEKRFAIRLVVRATLFAEALLVGLPVLPCPCSLTWLARMGTTERSARVAGELPNVQLLIASITSPQGEWVGQGVSHFAPHFSASRATLAATAVQRSGPVALS